jgi:hypothetical protein
MGMTVETHWSDICPAPMGAKAFAAPDPGTHTTGARDQILESCSRS